MNPSSHETILYEKKGKIVRCKICQRYCVIPEGKFGFCRTRYNENGKLFSLIYGQVEVIHIAPSEAKPIYHFKPGGRWLSLGTVGCNFRCIGCQNWHIAHYKIKNKNEKLSGEYMTPSSIVKIAQDSHCIGLSWTYNEPTVWFEYTLDGSRLAHKYGLFTSYVTNGYITKEALDLIAPYLSVFRVDIKSSQKEFYEKIAKGVEPRGIFEVTEYAKHRYNIWVEVVTNVIPGFNDSTRDLRTIAKWIYEHLGKDTPWHITQFVPHLKLSHLKSTSVETLERGYKIGKETGLNFVYIGNIPGHPYENTYCPHCGKLLIKRFHFDVIENKLKNDRCPYCGNKIPIVTTPFL